jgi:hypothetical protein
MVSGIYGHVENEFEVRNAPGLAFKQAAAGTLVDWELDTWSVVPAAEAKYPWPWRLPPMLDHAANARLQRAQRI